MSDVRFSRRNIKWDWESFPRAVMDNTSVGDSGKKESEPEARQGIEVPSSGKDHVYAASFKTKLEGVPGTVKREREMTKALDKRVLSSKTKNGG